LLNVQTGEIVAPVTLMPGEDVVLVAVVLPSEEIWTGNQSFVQRRADLVLTTNP